MDKRCFKYWNIKKKHRKYYKKNFNITFNFIYFFMSDTFWLTMSTPPPPPPPPPLSSQRKE